MWRGDGDISAFKKKIMQIYRWRQCLPLARLRLGGMSAQWALSGVKADMGRSGPHVGHFIASATASWLPSPLQ